MRRARHRRTVGSTGADQERPAERPQRERAQRKSRETQRRRRVPSPFARVDENEAAADPGREQDPRERQTEEQPEAAQKQARDRAPARRIPAREDRGCVALRGRRERTQDERRARSQAEQDPGGSKRCPDPRTHSVMVLRSAAERLRRGASPETIKRGKGMFEEGVRGGGRAPPRRARYRQMPGLEAGMVLNASAHMPMPQAGMPPLTQSCLQVPVAPSHW